MSPDGSTVTFRRVRGNLRRRPIERFARTLQSEVARGRWFDCLITTDAELRRLNRDFRGKDEATDVLSFPSGCRPPAPDRRLGDVAVSASRARVQARQFGHTVEQEIQILMLHGVLHLMGLDHETDRGRMARSERRWRTSLGLPQGLIERVRS